MINRRQFLIASSALTVSPFAFANQSEFERFAQSQLQGFADYKTALEAGFANYKKAIEEEFKNFRAGVRSTWGDQRVGSPIEWVEYSPDQQTRTRVDFEKAQIDIEVIAKDASSVSTKVRERLTDIATKTQAQAQKDDQLAQAIEKRVTQDASIVETAKPDTQSGAKPVLADVMTGKPQPTQAEIQASIVESVRAGKSANRPAAKPGEQVFVFTIPLKPANISAKADNFKPQVQNYAKEFKVDPALVLALMHSESSFNPMARSHIPAFGLMQIVPNSAGRDATELVYGKQRVLAPSYLYNADNNIKMGCAYMHILYYRYLRAIENEESRTYCVIAAYNTGAGNVARSFTGSSRSVREAAPMINKMTPKQVYDHLVANLPFEETRNYMTKVTPRYQAYQQIV